MTFASRLRVLGIVCAAPRQLRHVRTRFGLKGLVQIHHVIPRSCAPHPRLRALLPDFDVNKDPANLVLMPTHEGTRQLRLRIDRLVHDGGHMPYCHHVWDRLHDVEDEDGLVDLLVHLHRGMRWRDEGIPWR